MATPQLNPIPVKAPWYMVGIDFVGPVSPVAEDGSRFILTITDYFTKWADAITTPDKSASSVATALFKVTVHISDHSNLIIHLFYFHSALYAYGHTSSHLVRQREGV